MTPDEEKLCAFVRRSWFESARQHLNDAERLQLYESIFAYQFEEVEPSDLAPMVSLLFSMIKGTLTTDRERMKKRREVARANGMNGGRPKVYTNAQQETKPSWLNENQAGFAGLALYNTNTNMQISKNNVCPPLTRADKNSQGEKGDTNEDTHTKFLICLEFWEMGVSDAVEEGRKFWAYYDARGWVAGDGNPIKNVVSLAKTWKPKDLTMSIAKKRAKMRTLFNFLEFDDFSLFERLLSCEIDNHTQTVLLFVKTKENAVYLEERHIGALSKWVKSADGRSAEWRLEYSFANLQM